MPASSPIRSTLPEAAPAPIRATILVVEDDVTIQYLLEYALRPAGYEVWKAINGREAVDLLADALPDLIIADIGMPEMNGFELLAWLRSHPAAVHIPVIMLTAWDQPDDIIKGLDLGADDYLVKPVDMDVLRARVRAKLNRPPIPEDQLERDRRTGMFKQRAFLEEVERELTRLKTRRTGGFLALISLAEYDRLTQLLGHIDDPVARQMAELILHDGSPLEVVGRSPRNLFLLLMPEMSADEARERLRKLARRVVAQDFLIRKEHVRFTPVISFAPLDPDLSAPQLLDHIGLAHEYAAAQLDLEPMLYRPYMGAADSTLRRALKTITSDLRRVTHWTMVKQHARPVSQVLLTMAASLLLPFLIYVALGSYAESVTKVVYLGVIAGLLGTAALIWYEGWLALRPDALPEPVAPYPPASAIIPAYLPNEAATILSTIESFLRLDYPGPLQIILAYNTPRKMPIEQAIHDIARRDPRFMALHIQHSASKAQNVNAALEYVTGDFVAVFDADHQPDPDSFKRAWGWLSNGYDVVQGHCMIRNGDTSRVARTVAVEFEGIYAVSHPGRARLHGFGIFGGSNGFWRTNLLRETRMHGFMLTEDIDSSMRIIERGYRIKSDPLIISRELAPTTLSALWNQRLRWAQGWFQVAVKHTLPTLFRAHLTWRQKLGIFHLLVWREVYPWISIQILPIIAYWAWAKGGLDRIDWLVPIFVVTTLVTLGTGPGQLIYIRRLGHSSITRRRGWLLWYLAVCFAYAEYKNFIARVAQIKEITGERRWQTTPRN